VFEDKSGDLWVGTLDGLNKFNKNTNNFVRYPQISEDKADADMFPVFSIYEDQWQTIWLGTVEGLKRMVFDEKKNAYQIYSFKADTSDIHSISSNRVFTIFEDKAGKIWLGTGKGLNQLIIENPQKNPHLQTISFFNAQNSTEPVYKPL
jgi:ligand-binding sensor domain-containing protein